MIEEIRIRGLGVIDDAVLEPHPGFTAVTGETGAGKTMLLAGLGLLLGGRADPGVVRHGGRRAEVEGRFSVPADGAVAARVRDAGGDLDEGELLLARTISGEGRSRAYAGGRGAPAALLAEVGAGLVAVHGQSDQHRLRTPSRQRRALDRYAGAAVAEPLAAYHATWDRLGAAEAELAEVTTHARERAREADDLRAGLAQIAAVAPQPGEDDRLRLEASRLAHAEGLQEAAGSAHAALAGDDSFHDGASDAADLLATARRSLEHQRDHDPVLGALADRIAEVSALSSDIAADLAAYAASVDADPRRLAAVEERRAALGALTRKFGASADEVLAWADRASTRLATLDGDDERVAALHGVRARLRLELEDVGRALTEARSSAAAALGTAVTAELKGLAMAQARLTVQVRALPEPGPHGLDEVELLLAPHAGAEPAALAATASGGELSRVMLALEVVFAGTDPVPTMVFDEVDAGVGGRSAIEVGRRLARLASTTQVLVVTHLPQVAAFADRQVVVEKADDGRVTRSGLRVVEADERVRELARMLAGMESSETAAAHATELLAAASAQREPPRTTTRRRRAR